MTDDYWIKKYVMKELSNERTKELWDNIYNKFKNNEKHDYIIKFEDLNDIELRIEEIKKDYKED
ncbi:MAG: hypothetical protein ACP5RS_06800 [Thermoplasmata archaeon]